MSVISSFRFEPNEDNIVIARLKVRRLADLVVLEQLREELIQVLKGSPDCTRYVLDFTQVIYVMTNALHSLRVFNAEIKSKGGRLILCHLNSHLTHTFECTQLIPNVFEAAPKLQDAIDELRGQ